MSIKEYLKVHELAELFGLNVQTLHYYDKVGILKPSFRDPSMAIGNTDSISCISWHQSAI